MKLRFMLFIIALVTGTACVPAAAAGVDLSTGAYFGIIPSMGGNLGSLMQESIYGSPGGIDGIQRSADGFDTDRIDRLLGITGGIKVRAFFAEYFAARVAGNYSRSVYGGKGKTVYFSTAVESLECSYELTIIDIPLTVGLAIPFWKDMKISFTGGMAFAYGDYRNSFLSASARSRGKFTGWGYPLVIMLEGDYYLTSKLSINAFLSYYRGTTRTLKDGYRADNDFTTDFAEIDFTGYRFGFGVSYFFSMN
jgi:hypothetical protein